MSKAEEYVTPAQMVAKAQAKVRASASLRKPSAYKDVQRATCPYCGRSAEPHWNRGIWEFIHEYRWVHVNAVATGRAIACQVVFDGCRAAGSFGHRFGACRACEGYGGRWRGRIPYFKPCQACHGTRGRVLAASGKEDAAEAPVKQSDWKPCGACEGQGGVWDCAPPPEEWVVCAECGGKGTP